MKKANNKIVDFISYIWKKVLEETYDNRKVSDPIKDKVNVILFDRVRSLVRINRGVIRIIINEAGRSENK